MRPIALIATLLLAVPALHAGDEAKAKHPRLTELKAKYDTNHDGKLDEQERAAMRAAVAARIKSEHPKLFAELDTNGDGSLGQDEMKAGREKLKALRAKKKQAGQNDG